MQAKAYGPFNWHPTWWRKVYVGRENEGIWEFTALLCPKRRKIITSDLVWITDPSTTVKQMEWRYAPDDVVDAYEAWKRDAMLSLANYAVTGEYLRQPTKEIA